MKINTTNPIKKNFFCVFEGIDGSGKTTIAKKICEKYGWNYTAEPTNKGIGKLIKEILNNKLIIDKNILYALFHADRIEHIFSADGLLDLIQKENTICDRFVLSTFAYNEITNEIMEQEFNADKFLCPDITIFINVPVKIALSRILKDQSRDSLSIFETEKKLFRIYNRYEKYLEKYKYTHNIKIIDGTKPFFEVMQDVENILISYF